MGLVNIASAKTALSENTAPAVTALFVNTAMWNIPLCYFLLSTLQPSQDLQSFTQLRTSVGGFHHGLQAFLP